MEIKLIELDEIDDVLRIYSEAAEQMTKDGCLTWKNGYPNRNMAIEDIEDKAMYGAYDDEGDILGLLTLNNKVDPVYDDLRWETGDKPFLVIHRLAVSLKGKGKGIGSMLIDFSVEKARKHGCSSVRLDAYHKNWRAKRLYESKGFVDVGIVQFVKNDGVNYCLERVLNN